MRFLKRWRTRILIFFAVVGPGFITANVDNDAGGIWTYSSAGAQFGHALLWSLIPITIALIVVQEICARMGAVTGKGLSDLIREEFGLRITFFMMLGILIVNFANIFAGILAKPAWKDALIATVVPPPKHQLLQRDYLFMFIATVGTTIAPWMQFYLQSSIVEKGVTRRQYKTSRLDVITGCIFTDIVAWFIIVACAATLYVHGYHKIADAKDAAQALHLLAGDYAYILFAMGLFNASLFAASILPLSTAYTVCEGLGFESGVGKRFSEAPVFYWLYTILIAAGAGLILLPRLPLIKIQLYSQALNGVAIAPVLIFMLLLVTKKELMGNYVNSKLYNAVAWGLTAVMVILSVPFIWGTIRQIRH